MISSEEEFNVKFKEKLLENTILSRNITPAIISRYSPSGEPKIPSISSKIPLIYATINYLCHQKGVEIRPDIHPSLISNAQGGLAELDALGRIMEFHSMTKNSTILRHVSKAFATSTGRSVIYGPSLTSLKKKFWPFILNPISGYLYVLLDYGQQEPAIAACFASDRELQAACQGDLYMHVGQHRALAPLGRDELKAAVLPYSYGQRSEAYAKEHDIPVAEAQRRWYALREIFHLVDAELNRRSQLAFRDGFVRCLDWAARVTPLSNPLAVRNWPVQAAGADIMRRAVIGLYDAGIDLRLTIHDAFLIRVPIAEQEQQVAKAITVLTQASASVLGGFELNVKIDGVFDGQAGVM
ncbi:DNA polymerase [Aeromonas hydrophila]|uniref:DNA polymerase n=1 Tax=Aeromonas hydrophila TaxID=644 RepID=UPI0013147077|nr:DNA polymerase [Aeromonas hydrophila]